MRPLRTLMLLSTALVALPAFAHTGLHLGVGFGSGLAHPFLGLDHLLAMVLVGLWAAQQQGAAQRMAPPLVFIACMALGSYLGESGLAIPRVEEGVALSVLGLGLLAAFAVRLPLFASLSVIGAFALCHGQVHGSEMPVVALWTYIPGVLLATALLHGLGYYSASRLMDNRSRWVRAAGMLAAIAGGGLLAG